MSTIDHCVLQQRDQAIDFVKIIAVLFVLNSHMGVCYPRWSFLATGGGIGDALFFFISGFTLFLGRPLPFVDWYKRRIRRIYPALFATALLASFIFGQTDSFSSIVLSRRYWFVQCILVLYPILFLIKSYCRNPVPLFCCVVFLSLACFPLFYKGSGLFYGGGYYRWFVYFSFMLFGAILGQRRNDLGSFSPYYCISLLFCTFAWYLVVYYTNRSVWQICSVIPLFGVVYSFYMIGRCELVTSLFTSKVWGSLASSIGGLCLECYLVQKYVITDKLNFMFPMNILIIILLVLIVSYCVHILSQIISQLFDSKPFDYRSLFVVK